METKIINPSLVRLDAELGSTPEEVITSLAAIVTEAGRSTSEAELAAAAHAREAKSHTGVPGGVAIPHCRCAAVTEPTLGFARLKNPVDFGAPDGPADLTFLIAAPEGGGREHLKILSTLARALVNKKFVQSLRSARLLPPPPRMHPQLSSRRCPRWPAMSPVSWPLPPAPPASRTRTWPPTR